MSFRCRVVDGVVLDIFGAFNAGVEGLWGGGVGGGGDDEELPRTDIK